MPRHIGIVACSAEGAALCYRTICAEGPSLLGPHNHPEVSMHTHPLAEYMLHIERGDWEGVGKLMISSACKLHASGAEFLICPDNTIHRIFPYAATLSPLPWMHIADAVIAEAALRGFTSIGMMGTRWLVESDVYPHRFEASGIGFLRPSDQERETVNDVIMDELVYGIFKPESIARLQDVIQNLKQQGCDAVLLGCTELPLVLNDENSALPTLDSTRLLARAALRHAIEEP